MNFPGLAAICLATPVVCAAPAAELPAAVNKAFADYTALPGKLITVLQKVRDKDSADAAAPELRAALSAIYEARDQLHNMPRLTAAQNEQVRRQYGQRMREEWGRMYEQIERLRQARCFQSVPLAREFRLMCMMIEK